MGKKIFFDIVQFEVGLVQWVIAGLAKPKEAVGKAPSSPLAFNHQAQGAVFAYRRMGDSGWTDEQVTRAQAVFNAYSVLLCFERNPSFQLLEDLLGLVVVVVLAGIGPGDHHDDIIIALRAEVFVGDRRSKQMPVVGQPLGEVKGGNGGHSKTVYLTKIQPNRSAQSS